MTSKNAIALALSSLFVASAANAVTIYEDENGDFVKLYGEVGVGGHIGANYDYGEFYADQNFIDDSFATMGVKGKNDKMHYRLELDYERENWKGGSGDMVLAIDKVFIGYDLYKSKNQEHYVEVGLTDTAFDDYDKWGDFTFDTTVETGEAGDQDMTAKYEGRYFGSIKVGASYTNRAESSSGSELGEIVNGYIGYFGDRFSVVAGAEARGGSDGSSSYGEQLLYGVGARISVTDNLDLGLNAFIEEEDRSREDPTCLDNCLPGEEDPVEQYNDFQTEDNKGYLASVRYKFSEVWEFTASYNFEEYQSWGDVNRNYSARYGKDYYSWGDERVWSTFGVNYRPTRSSVIAFEWNTGEAAQDAYAYARVYF
ncbi:porin [Vibrio profundi]|uniref:porin n=1 Tax=Vibrio profundi TaxID=1774960 RepID=UPI003735CB25